MTDAVAMSVIVVTPSDCAAVGRLLERLRAQTVRERLELVLVAPSEPPDIAEAGLDVFGQTRVVLVNPRLGVAHRRAVGVRQASAPIVAFTEEHSLPDPHWAEALIQAHQGGWAAVGPEIGNANPDSATSWATLIIQYAPWMQPSRSGVVNDLPGHNSTYRRDLLLAYGADLEKMLEFEHSLHSELRARGYRLYLEARARTYHLNVTRPWSWLWEQFYTGRLFAGTRVRSWSRAHRLLYIVGAPLIPVIRLWRCLAEIRRRNLQRPLWPQILPLMLLGLVVTTVGEVVGYALGAGNTAEALLDIELHRERHVSGLQSLP